MKPLLLVALLLLVFFFKADAKTYSYFIPPKKWEPASPEEKQTHVQLGFLGPNQKGFAPSVNLAIEKVGEIPLKTYLKAVRSIHERSPDSQWRQLGKIRTQAGEAALTEIDSKTEWGDVRMMQAILIEDKTAYIITASALKEEFGKYTRDFQKAFQSFTLQSDLFDAVTDEEKKNSLKEAFSRVRSALGDTSPKDKKFQKDCLSPFEKKVVTEFQELGTMWQILVIKEAIEQ